MRISTYTIFGVSATLAGILTGLVSVGFVLFKYENPLLYLTAISITYAFSITLSLLATKHKITLTGHIIVILVSMIALGAGYFATAYTYCNFVFEVIPYKLKPIGCFFSNAIGGMLGGVIFAFVFLFWRSVFDKTKVLWGLPAAGGLGSVFHAIVGLFFERHLLDDISLLVFLSISFSLWQAVFSLALAWCLTKQNLKSQIYRDEAFGVMTE